MFRKNLIDKTKLKLIVGGASALAGLSFFDKQKPSVTIQTPDSFFYKSKNGTFSLYHGPVADWPAANAGGGVIVENGELTFGPHSKPLKR